MFENKSGVIQHGIIEEILKNNETYISEELILKRIVNMLKMSLFK